MNRFALWIGAWMCVFALVTLPAQRRPDFSGTWQVDLEKTQAPQFGPKGPPPELAKVTVTQTPIEVTIEAGTEKQRFKLDGTKSTITGVRRQPITGTTAWEGDTLVIEAAQTLDAPDGTTVTLAIRETLSLDASRQFLTLERVVRTPKGERASRTVFKRRP